MLEIVGAVIDNHAEQKEATDDDFWRCGELEEARTPGLAEAREMIIRVGVEITKKVTRTAADCAARVFLFVL